MLPSIGRIVWANLPDKSEQFCAALVTFVHGDKDGVSSRVNLAAFDRNGDSHPLTFVDFYHGDDGNIPVGLCGWMPYQIQAEAKRQAAEYEAQGVQFKDRLEFIEKQLLDLEKAISALNRLTVAKPAQANVGDYKGPAPGGVVSPSSK